MFLKHQQGTTLIEAIVAAVIISVGLLGIAALQTKALQASSEAEYRSKAIDLAWALADRMRANLKSNHDGGDYYASEVVTCSTAVKQCSMVPGGDTSDADTCNAQEMARFDLFEIQCADNFGVTQILPGGQMAVTCNDKDLTDTDPCTPGSELMITITWNKRGTQDGEATVDNIMMGIIPGGDPGF